MNENLKKLLQRMEAITGKARAESRSMTADEVSDYEAAKALFDGELATIKASDDVERMRSVFAAQGLVAGFEKPVTPAQRMDIGLTDAEIKRYSITRALASTLPELGIDAGFEREVSMEVAKRYGKSPNGIYLPHDVLSQRDLSVGTPSAGGNLVATDYRPGSFIDILRNKALMFKLGVQTLTGLQGNVAIPKQTGAGAAYWVAEGGAATQGDLSVGLINMTPKTLAAKSATTRQALLQANPSIDALMMNDIAKVIGLAIDSAIISGTGASNQPLGILGTSGVASVSMATASGGLNWSNVVALEKALELANYDMNTVNLVTNPTIKALAKTTLRSATAGSSFLWADDGTMNGYNAYATNQIAANTILFGDFSEVVVGMWGGLDLMLDPYAKADTGGLVVRAFQSCDIATRYGAAFAVSQNVGL